MSACGVGGCERQRHAKGFCAMHYRRMRRGASMAPAPLMRPPHLPVMDRLFLDVDTTDPDACWRYRGTVDRQGYGKIQQDRSYWKAHRLSYTLLVGPIPAGLEIDHLCHNDSGCAGGVTCEHRACINPSHLEAVEHWENSARSPHTIIGRSVRTIECMNGHPFSAENTYTKPTGGRVCRTCRRQHQEAYRARRRGAAA